MMRTRPVRQGKSQNKSKACKSLNLRAFLLCARHEYKPGGASPLRALIVGTVSLRQGCLPWGRIWKKPAAKSRSDEQKFHIRQKVMEESAIQVKFRYYPRSLFVNAADTRRCCLFLMLLRDYPGNHPEAKLYLVFHGDRLHTLKHRREKVRDRLFLQPGIRRTAAKDQ